MTDEEKVTGAAMAAKAMGRRVLVLAAMKDSSDRADLVGIGMVDEILSDYPKATMISLPRKDAELLLVDLMSVLNGRSTNIEDALRVLATKGAKA